MTQWSPLTPRQLEALRYHAQGLTAEAAGRRMGISMSSVNQLIATAKRHLSAKSITHAVAIAMALRLIHPWDIPIPGEQPPRRRGNER